MGKAVLFKGMLVLGLAVMALAAAGCGEPLIREDAGDAGNRPAEGGLAGTLGTDACGAGGAGHAGDAEPSGDAAGAVKTFTVRATKYEFDLREIRVRQGDTVELRLENAKGYHTLKLEGYNVEVKQNKPVTFVAAEKGTFAFRCGIVCGSGHDGMTGVLIVE
jgi:cytochrome c oxidase subunit 2